MANTLSSTGISNGSRILPAHISQITDALSKQEAYDITISGSLVVTGSAKFDSTLSAVSMSGDGSALTGILNAVTSSHSLFNDSSSHAITANTASLALSGNGVFSGSFSGSHTGIVLTAVSESLNFADDAAAATGGVALGGLYRSGSFVKIRIS